MSIRAVLFDLDGTLLDTLADIGQSVNQVLTTNGFSVHPIDAYRQFVGNGVTALFERALPEAGRDARTIERCVDQFRGAYADQLDKHTALYEGIASMLDQLSQRSLRLSVLSNKPHDATCRCVQGYLAAWPFDVVFGQRDGVPAKPDPSGAIEIAERVGLPASDFLYLGDTGVDMQTALRAGMTPVGVLWGFRTREELENAGAAHLVKHPREVLELVV